LHRPPFLLIQIKHLEEIISAFFSPCYCARTLEVAEENYDSIATIGLLVFISSAKSDIASLDVAV